MVQVVGVLEKMTTASSSDDRLVRLSCYKAGRGSDFMSAKKVRRLESQSIDPCDCTGVRGDSGRCNFIGPQVVPAPPGEN